MRSRRLAWKGRGAAFEASSRLSKAISLPVIHLDLHRSWTVSSMHPGAARTEAWAAMLAKQASPPVAIFLSMQGFPEGAAGPILRCKMYWVEGDPADAEVSGGGGRKAACLFSYCERHHKL